MQSSEARAKAQQELTRRLIISDWVQQNLEVRLPTAADADFRAALQDGVLLCKLLNIVRPGTVRKVSCCCISRSSLKQLSSCVGAQIHEPESVRNSTGSRIQHMENLSNFLSALSAMDFPPVALFSIADMEADDSEERCSLRQVAQAIVVIPGEQTRDRVAMADDHTLWRRCSTGRAHNLSQSGWFMLWPACRPLVTKCLLTLKRFHDTETTLPPTPRGTFRASLGSPRELPGRTPLPPKAPSPAPTATPDINTDTLLAVRGSALPVSDGYSCHMHALARSQLARQCVQCAGWPLIHDLWCAALLRLSRQGLHSSAFQPRAAGKLCLATCRNTACA